MANDRPDPHSRRDPRDGARQEVADDLQNAIAVTAAMRQIDAAIADLAASPLDEPAAERMRQVLQGPQLAKAREVVREFSPRPRSGRRSHLSVVPCTPGGAEISGGLA